MAVPRITSRTPLREPILPSHKPTASLSYSASIMAVLQPRKHRHRTTFVALLALLSLSAYVFVFQQSAFSPALSLQRADVPTRHMTLALQALQSNHHARPPAHSHSRTPQLQFRDTQELAAVSSFLSSLPQNVIPSYVDPEHPIDPELVLDFDTRSSHAANELKHMEEDVWSRNPVFLYSKLYSPVSREVKAMLSELNLSPAPTVMDVDTRDDGDILQRLVQRLVASDDDLPILLIGGKHVGSMADIRALHQSGQLREMIAASGAVIDGAKKRKHKK